MTTTDPTPSAAELRARFDANHPGTVGIEEELMLIDAASGALLHDEDLRDEVAGTDERFKPELPVSQIEVVLPPATSAGEVREALMDARGTLRGGCERVAVLACGAHPAAPAAGRLSGGEHYADLVGEYGPFAGRQLICALQVHVAPGGAMRALSVYNHLRSYLPEIARAGGECPLPRGAGQRHGLDPPQGRRGAAATGRAARVRELEDFAAALAWTREAGGTDRGTWWWELAAAPGPRHDRAAGPRHPDHRGGRRRGDRLRAVARRLARQASGRRRRPPRPRPLADRAEPLVGKPSRSRGTLADLDTGERRPTGERLLKLIDLLGPTASELGAGEELGHARRLAARNGAIAQREAAAELGSADALALHLGARFLAAD